MTLMRFILGLAAVTATVAAWSAWSGADGWTFAIRIVVSLVLVQLGYVAIVLWTAYRAAGQGARRERSPAAETPLERARRKPAKRAL